jgi:hypothetical protein
MSITSVEKLQYKTNLKKCIQCFYNRNIITSPQERRIKSNQFHSSNWIHAVLRIWKMVFYYIDHTEFEFDALYIKHFGSAILRPHLEGSGGRIWDRTKIRPTTTTTLAGCTLQFSPITTAPSATVYNENIFNNNMKWDRTYIITRH